MSIIDSLTSKLGSFIGLNGSLPQRKTVGFDINEFKSIISVTGVVPTNLFLVTIYPYPNVKNIMSAASHDEKSLSFFCMQTDLPGVTMSTEDNKILGTGPIEKFPYTALFGDIDLTFIGDARGSVMFFFQNWLNSIVKFDNKQQSESFYRVNYRDNYLCKIEIEVFNQSSDSILKYNIREAFPYKLNQTKMDWNSHDMMTIDVSFNYKSWDSEQIAVSREDYNGGLSTVQKLLKLGTIAQTVMSLKKPQSVGDAINLVNNANIIGGGMSGFF